MNACPMSIAVSERTNAFHSMYCSANCLRLHDVVTLMNSYLVSLGLILTELVASRRAFDLSPSPPCRLAKIVLFAVVPGSRNISCVAWSLLIC